MKAYFRSIILIVSFLMSANVMAQFYDFDKKPQELEQYVGKGKWTVVMFWASNCHVCNVEAEQYIQFHESHKDTDALVVGISLDGLSGDGLKKAKGFIKRHDVTFPNLIGSRSDVIYYYTQVINGPWQGTPSFLIYTPKGELVAAQAGAVPADLIEEFMASQSAAK